MSELKAQLNDIKRAWRWVLALGGTATALHAAIVLTAIVCGDQVLRGTDPAPALWFAAVVTASAILTIALATINRRILDRAALWIDHTIAKSLLAGRIEPSSSLTTASDPAPQIDALRNGFSNASLATAARTICLPAFILVLLLVDHRAAALASIIFAVGLGVILGGMSGRKVHGDHASLRARTISSLDPRNLSIVRATSLDAAIQGMWLANTTKAVASSYARLRSNGRWELAGNAFAAVSLICAVALAAAAMHEGMINRFEAVVSIATIAWMTYVIRSAIVVAPDLGTTWKAWKSLVSRLQLTTLPPQPAPPGAIRIDNGSVLQPGRNHAAVTSVTMACQPGETLIVSGTPGAGKSTLAALIAGAVPPTEGRYQNGGLRIGYVPEAPLLLEGTVAQNIARFTRYDLQTVMAAVDRAGVRSTLRDLGLEMPLQCSLLQPFGPLSLREARAINLARAVFAPIDILVVDKPELAMELADVHAIIGALRQLRASGVGLVIASNDTRFHAFADRFVHLDNSRIVQSPFARTYTQHTFPSHGTRGQRLAMAR